MSGGTPLTDADRIPWLREIAARIDAWRSRGESGVVTCSALKRSYRDLLRDGHPSVRFVHLVAPAAVLAVRLNERPGHYMPPALLASQIETLEPLGPDEPGAVVTADRGPAETVAAIQSLLESRDS